MERNDELIQSKLKDNWYIASIYEVGQKDMYVYCIGSKEAEDDLPVYIVSEAGTMLTNKADPQFTELTKRAKRIYINPIAEKAQEKYDRLYGKYEEEDEE